VTASSQKDRDRWLQSALKQLVDPALVVDGDLRPRSRTAIKTFQKQHGLTVDGIAGPATIAALEAASGALHTAAVATEQEDDQPGSDAADADDDAAADNDTATIAVATPPLHTYNEQRISVRIYGKLSGDSELLVPVPATGGPKRLHKVAAAALLRMAEAVRRDLAIELKLASAWRAHRWQSREQYEAVLVAKFGSVAEGRRWLAFDSPHETGLAIDIGVGGLKPSRASVTFQRKQPLHQWMVAHAWEYGFHPYKVEPWHWEFPISREAYASGVVADDDPGPPINISFDPNDLDLDAVVLEDEDLEEYPS
jgi:hypothetical protein